MTRRGGKRHRSAGAALGAILCALLLQAAAQAATLRIASAFDPQTMDPHAIAVIYNYRVYTQIYEFLVDRDPDFKLEPALALSWEAVKPTTWRFRLRPGVQFHDGGTLNADDVVFSIERALSRTSARASQLAGVAAARRVDDLTVDIDLSSPDAVLPEKLWQVAIMSKAWCVEHHVEKPLDYSRHEETWANRHANGTGPYRLKSYEPDLRTVLVANPSWWGKRGNVDESVFVSMLSDATRLAALASGEVDLVLDPPLQDIGRLARDPRFALAETTDLATSYLVFNLGRDELAESGVKGRNPFRDLRVRRAVYQAIDMDAIAAKMLRGRATPTGMALSPRLGGALDEEPRMPFDRDAARALLKDAGYAAGFDVDFDCVNSPLREAVCQAIAGMLAQVGIRAHLHTWPGAQFFPKVVDGQASLYEVGYSASGDAWFPLYGLFHSWSAGGPGYFNGGRYANPQLDRILDAARSDLDLARRRQSLADAQRLLLRELPSVPLYRRQLGWIMRRGVHVVLWPNDVPELRFAKVD
ncbi:MAG TPA: ABC transporter substrate-binding protein [Burkholderiaceae bacterium]|nr:ABC transporter substrate-binding protein [Burkholderiaceae bacterium]